jgi:hypothetical protein
MFCEKKKLIYEEIKVLPRNKYLARKIYMASILGGLIGGWYIGPRCRSAG